MIRRLLLCLPLALLGTNAWSQASWFSDPGAFGPQAVGPGHAHPGSIEQRSPEIEWLLTLGEEDEYDMTVVLDAIILGRTGLKANVLAVDGSGNPVLDTADVKLEGQIGPRVSILMGGRKTGLDFSFFGINDNSFSGRFDQPGITPSFFGGVPADPADSYDIHYQGRLSSAELMFWQGVDSNARFGVGIRGIGLSETFNVLDSSESNSGFFSDTGNDLVGLQFGGGLGLMRFRKFSLDATVKTGVYYHNTELNAIAENDELHTDETDATNVTELDVGGSLHMSRNCSIRGGYLALWLFDVGLATNQNDDWNIFSDSGSFDYSTAAYHGGYFGMEFRW